MPETIGASKFASNSCSCPDCAGFGSMSEDGFTVGEFHCYNGADHVMIAAWKRFVGIENENLYIVENDVFESFAHHLIFRGSFVVEAVPFGKGYDTPPPALYSYWQSDGGHMNVPLSVMQSEEKVEKLFDILKDCLFDQTCMRHGTYILGGDIPYSGDGMTAFPMHRRYGTLMFRPYQKETYNKVLDLFYEAEDEEPVSGDNFPGSDCHNHFGYFSRTLQRDDWTKVCDLEWDDLKRHEKCFTLQEATFGVENLKKLEKIHAMVDPNRLFDCTDCVGYGDEDDKGKKGKKFKKDKKGLKGGKKKKYGGYDNHPLYCLAGDISLIGNGICDESMNNPQCHYDGGDCDF